MQYKRKKKEFGKTNNQNILDIFFSKQIPKISYIEWSSHQPEPDIFDFKGNLNFLKYFQLAQQTNLLVIVRLGPFIAGERDNVRIFFINIRLN